MIRSSCIFLKIIISILLNCGNIQSQTNDSIFSNIENALLSPSSVRTLDLNGQNLNSLPNEISTFENLSTLVLSGNPNLDLKKVFQELSANKKLKILYLENNKLPTLPEEIALLKKLESLYLSNNRINYIPKSMKKMQLNYLDLSDNYISDANLNNIFKIIDNKTLINISKHFKGQENLSLKYFEEANKATHSGQLLLADSLYTLSLALERHKDTYFNRAIVRKRLNRTADYCLDLGSASSMNDNEATKLYWKECGTIDSTYFNDELIPVKKGEHTFCEIKSKSKYSTYMRFKRINVKNELLVHFEVINDDSIFYLTTDPPKYPVSENDLISKIAGSVIPTNEEKSRINESIVIMTFKILPSGDIDEIMIFSGLNKSYNDRLKESLEQQVKKWEPAKFENKPVIFKKWIKFYVKV